MLSRYDLPPVTGTSYSHEHRSRVLSRHHSPPVQELQPPRGHRSRVLGRHMMAMCIPETQRSSLAQLSLARGSKS